MTRIGNAGCIAWLVTMNRYSRLVKGNTIRAGVKSPITGFLENIAARVIATVI